MSSPAPHPESVVILVDNRWRDLDLAALIAAHVRRRGVPCHLVPLEAYQAVLASCRPGIIVFNHLSASHIARYSKRLSQMGVVAALLLNEGISYDPEVRRYVASQYHSDHAFGLFLAWNDANAETLRQLNGPLPRIETVGVPRFDFYFSPWRRTQTWGARGDTGTPFPDNGRKNVLFATNFVCAGMKDWPVDRVDAFFKLFAQNISRYRDYPQAISDHWDARRRHADFVIALAETDRYNIVLRPHPGEFPSFYEDWWQGAPESVRKNVRIDADSAIAHLIESSDLHIVCETCTTALEAWICGKPTIALEFARNPLWYEDVQCRLNEPCDQPETLPGLAERLLDQPPDQALLKQRRQHLDTWCGAPDGHSAERTAEILVDTIRTKQPADWSQLTWDDRRRAMKLQLKERLNLGYHYDPTFPVRRLFGGARYGKVRAYDKSITPSDARQAIVRMEQAAEASGPLGRGA